MQAKHLKDVFGFLSYKRDDMQKHDLQRFLNELELLVNKRLKRHRFCIQSDRDIQHGKDWNQEINNLIDRASIYFIAMSNEFLASTQCLNEVYLIRESKKKANKQIHVLSIESVRIKDETEAIRDLLSKQFFRLPRPEERSMRSGEMPTPAFFRYREDMHKLCNDIVGFIEVESPRLPTLSRRLLLGASLVGGGAMSAVWLDQFRHRSASVEPVLPKVRKVEWLMADGFSSNRRTGTSQFGAQYIATLVEKMSAGQFLIRLVDSQRLDDLQPSDEQIQKPDLLQLVDGGAIQCAYTASYYYRKKYPSLIFGTTVPFGLNAQQQLAWLNHSYADEARYQVPEAQMFPLTVMQSHLRDLGLNVIPFTAGGTGGQMGGWFKEPIPENATSFIDYANQLPHKKFRFRIAGLGGDIIKQRSENIIIEADLVGREITEALEAGKLDAAEWIGPLEDTSISLNSISGFKYYYWPGWWDPGTTYDLLVNLKAWDELSQENKFILKAACDQACQQILSFYDRENASALQAMKGITLQPFPAKLLDEMRKETTDVLDRVFGHMSKTATSAQIKLYQEWNAFRQNIKQWYAYVDSDSCPKS